MAIPLNQDLPLSYQVPGVYVYQSRAGAAPSATNRRVLLLGYKTREGSALAGSPERILSEDDLIQKTGKGSELHRMFRAFASQGGAGADLYILPLNAPSGTAQTRLLTILQSPSGAALGIGNTGAVAAGTLSVWICGQRFDLQVANGDTFAAIAANLAAQIQAGQDVLPCTATVVGATVTLTARHASLSSADLPVMLKVSNPSMAIAVSPGTIQVVGAASGAGFAKVGVATQTAQAAVANLDTANAIAAALVAAINSANAFPVAAAQTAPSDTVTLFYQPERVFNFSQAAITTGITTTLTFSSGADGSGLPSSSSPSLSQVLTNLEAQEAFKLIVTSYTGAAARITEAGYTQYGSLSDYSVLGTLSSHIEQQANGLICKGQELVLADTRSLAVSGSIPTGTTPNLILSPRYFLGWSPANPQQAYELAARMAALVMDRIDYPNFNYAGQSLRTDSRVPFLLPHDAVRPSNGDVNAAMLSYFLSPLRTEEGQLQVVSGRTTAKPSASLDFRYSFWGVALADDYVRDDLRASLPSVFRGRNCKNYSPPNTQFTFTPDAIRTALASRMAFYDSLDIFDGSDDLVPGVAALTNGVLPSRMDAVLPKRFAIPAEQVSVVTTLES